MPLDTQEKAVAATWRDRMTAVTALCSVGAALPPPVGPILGSVAAGSGASAWLANRYASDPPDPDINRAAVPGRRPIPLESIAGIGAPPAVVRFAGAVNEIDAYGGAALRAYERAEAAWDRGADDVLSRRLNEVRQRSRTAAQHVDSLAEWTPKAAEHIGAWLGNEDLDRLREAITGPEDLPESTLAFLYTAGVPYADLRRAFEVSAPVRITVVDPPARWLDVEPASRAFGRFLRTWEPEQQVRRRPPQRPG